MKIVSVPGTVRGVQLRVPSLAERNRDFTRSMGYGITKIRTTVQATPSTRSTSTSMQMLLPLFL